MNKKSKGIFLLIFCGILFTSFLQSKIFIKSPIGITKWFKGERGEILWDKTGTTADRVLILLLDKDKERKILTIAINTKNDGSFLWKIPNTRRLTGGMKYVVRIIGDRISGESPPFLINKAKVGIRSKKPQNLSTVNPNSVEVGTDKSNVKPLPDFVVDNIYATDRLELCIRVKNVGAKKFSGKLEYEYTIKNRKMKLAKDCTIYKNSTFIIKTGRILNGNDVEKDLKKVKVSANLDWRNQIAEFKENNNYREMGVWPKLSRPDYLPVKVTARRGYPNQGKTERSYRFYCYIKNAGNSYKGDIKIIWKIKMLNGQIKGGIWGPHSLEISPLRDERIHLTDKRSFWIDIRHLLSRYDCEVEIIPCNGNLELNLANNKSKFRFTKE